jgi:hypothetical protein
MHIADGFFLFLILSAVVCVVVQALLPVSRGKSNVRFAGSLLVGIVFGAEALLQIASRHRLWPEVLLLLMGGLLIWVGARKRNRDPEGRTPQRLSCDPRWQLAHAFER